MTNITQHTFFLKKIGKDIHIMLPDLELLLSLISLNYPCLKHLFLVPKMLKPVGFGCTLFAKQRFILSRYVLLQDEFIDDDDDDENNDEGDEVDGDVGGDDTDDVEDGEEEEKETFTGFTVKNKHG